MRSVDHRELLTRNPYLHLFLHAMVKTAQDTLSQAGLRSTLVDYQGGHGWKGNVYGNIRQGLEWLQKQNDLKPTLRERNHFCLAQT